MLLTMTTVIPGGGGIEIGGQTVKGTEGLVDAARVQNGVDESLDST